MSEVKKRQTEIVAEFNRLNSWEDRYKKIIAIGKELPDLPKEKKLDEFKVKGCQSQVWIHAKLSDDNKVLFEADSDALIVRGLVSLLLKVYSNATPQDILETPPDFIEDLGFHSNLSPSRANGLMSMIKQIKYYATAFQLMVNR